MAEFKTLDESWASEIRPITLSDSCPICNDPFTPDHRSVISRGCVHIFGASCLRKWFDSITNYAFNCPMCRRICFHIAGNIEGPANMEHFDQGSDEEVDEEDEGAGESAEEEDAVEQDDVDSDDGDWNMEDNPMGDTAVTLESLQNRETAAVFVGILYRELLTTENDAVDTDMKACVEQALLDADIDASIPLSDKLWADIRGMVKRMLRDSKSTAWDDQVERRWVARLVRALGLRLE